MDQKEVLREEKRLLKMSEISLLIDDYDDIFSDFDPRSYSQRAISDDLLAETRRASRDKASGTIELKFMVLSNNRDMGSENIIKKRLHSHFKRHADRLKDEMKSLIVQGSVFVAFGMLLMFIAAFIMFKDYGKLISSFLIILLEPASWFLFWEGLRQVVFESKAKRPENEFYEKMSRCDIKFSSYKQE